MTRTPDRFASNVGCTCTKRVIDIAQNLVPHGLTSTCLPPNFRALQGGVPYSSNPARLFEQMSKRRATWPKCLTLQRY